MIINRVISNMNEKKPQGKLIDRVYFEWYEQEKKLFKKVSEFGQELGIQLEQPLKDGDILYEDDKKVIAAEVLPAHLTQIRVQTMEEMGRLCFELGNRHLSLLIESGRVTVPYDESTFLYLKKLGFDVKKTEDKFTGYTVCHAHGGASAHSHTH